MRRSIPNITLGLLLLAGGPAFAEDPAQETTAATPAPPAVPDFGDNFFVRLFNYEKYEIVNGAAPPADPNAPSAHRDPPWPPSPVSAPPMPFYDWPYGGTTTIGDNRTASIDSPLMVALSPTGPGQWLEKQGIQVYGWIDYGGNISNAKVEGGNAPAAYAYNPNTINLDQAVLYVERTPDTVQQDHVDWGFRLSGLYGTNYRYTTAYGLWSYQLLKYNKPMGYDAPMVYGELYIPNVADGLMLRLGRFISLPDIEAQLAPNNYMYTHSMTYTFDNYTNTGLVATLAANKNIFLQFAITSGTETLPWRVGATVPNPYPNVLYPGATFKQDPGAQPSYSFCVNWKTDSSDDGGNVCANAINNGKWGYNNLQWYGGTYYHKFNDAWHISVEVYNEHQDDVPNALNSTVQTIVANNGTPFSTAQLLFNAPGLATCSNPAVLKCKAEATGVVEYLNYQFAPLDNLSLRAEYYDDPQGQRTGVKAKYWETGLGWQHWIGPQIELRPEVTYYQANAPAFDGNSNHGIAPSMKHLLLWSGDVIWHF